MTGPWDQAKAPAPALADAPHEAIIAALLARDADRAETLVRDHTLGLAAHVRAHWDEPGAGHARQRAGAV